MAAVNTCELSMETSSERKGPTTPSIADFTNFAGRMLVESIIVPPIISIQLVIWFARQKKILKKMNNRFKTNNAKYMAVLNT